VKVNSVKGFSTLGQNGSLYIGAKTIDILDNGLFHAISTKNGGAKQ